MSDINLLKPILLFEQFFESNVRLDDRDPLRHASLHVSAGVLPSCRGSALVRIGETQVICGVQVKVLPDQPNSGHLVCTVEISELANRITHPGSSISNEAQSLSSKVQRLVDTVICPNAAEQLNIFTDTANEQPIASYVLKVDVLVLHDDGCLLDACVPAVLVSLRSTRWPKLIAVSGTQRNTPCVECYRDSCGEMVTLTLSESPIPITCCFLPVAVCEVKASHTFPIVIQPSRRDSILWDVDFGPMQLTLTITGHVLYMNMVNAFLPNLYGVFSSTADTSKTKQTDVDVWRTLFDSCTVYVRAMKSAIDAAVGVHSL